ncbi:MAG: hypothetical protein AB1400_09050 [Pseudomonadota bacterium]
MSDELQPVPTDMQMQSLKNVTTAVYALYALSWFFGVTALVGIVLNYIKREEVAGTWLESHFRWQIRTFWFGLLWSVVGALLVVVLVGFAILFANAVWLIYRVAKGWLNLNDGKPMPV